MPETLPLYSRFRDARDPLVAFVYSSRATRSLSADELKGMLQGSRARNYFRGLTGILVHRDGRFLQYLEGTADAVEERISRIREDERHRDFTVLLDAPVDERLFSDWTMAYEPHDDSAEESSGFGALLDIEHGAPDAGAIMRSVRRTATGLADRRQLPSP